MIYKLIILISIIKYVKNITPIVIISAHNYTSILEINFNINRCSKNILCIILALLFENKETKRLDNNNIINNRENDIYLTYDNLSEICPVILYNYFNIDDDDIKNIRKKYYYNNLSTYSLINKDNITINITDKSYKKAWAWTLLASFIINLCAGNGFILLNLMKKELFDRVIVLLISLAVGILISNAILHLIPNSMDFNINEDKNQYYKLILILVGVYTFLIFEIILKSIVSWKRGIQVPPLTLSCCNYINNHNISDSLSNISHHSNILYTTNNNKKPFYSPVFLYPYISQSATLMLVGDAVHNFIDGLLIGSSFSESFKTGFSVSFAIFFEEFAHELGDFAALVNAGMTSQQALFWNIVASSTNFIGAAIGLALGIFPKFLPFIECYCAGMFIYLSLVVMLPEAIEKTVIISQGNKNKFIINVLLHLFGILIGMCIMLTMVYTQQIYNVE